MTNEIKQMTRAQRDKQQREWAAKRAAANIERIENEPRDAFKTNGVVMDCDLNRTKMKG